MASKKTIKGAISSAVKSQLGWAKMYRDNAKALRTVGSQLPVGLPAENLDIDKYKITYNPENAEQANILRGNVGRVLGINKWEKRVNSYSGDISYNAEYKLPSGSTIGVIINNGELAPGCQVVQVEETRKVWKSVCPEQKTEQTELTS